MNVSGDRDWSQIVWKGEFIPESSRFGDVYYSTEDGLAETEYVFIEGNNLSVRFETCSRFSIGELGFGTGLNFLTNLIKFNALAPKGAHLTYSSVELYPVAPKDIKLALKRWNVLGGMIDVFVENYSEIHPGLNVLEFPKWNVVLNLWAWCDARDAVPCYPHLQDAWYLDGFSPTCNPELWQLELFKKIKDRSGPKATIATFSAAGHVRRNLCSIGFKVNRRPGFGSKRECLAGIAS